MSCRPLVGVGFAEAAIAKIAVRQSERAKRIATSVGLRRASRLRKVER